MAATAPAIPSQTVALDEKALLNAAPIDAIACAIPNIATTGALAPASSAKPPSAPARSLAAWKLICMLCASFWAPLFISSCRRMSISSRRLSISIAESPIARYAAAYESNSANCSRRMATVSFCAASSPPVACAFRIRFRYSDCF